MSTAPGWVVHLEFAAEMHAPPWEIFGGRKILWWFRWKAVRDEMMKVKNK